jgi:hypothetical protein
LLQQLLRFIWTVKGFALAVYAGSGVVAANNKVIGTMVAPDDGVPKCLSRSTTHGKEAG